MSRLDELIAELCPDGVEYKMLGEVTECCAGATPKTGVAKYWENGTIPWMSSGEVNKGIIFDTDVKITELAYESCSTKLVPANTVVVALAGQGKTRGKVARTRIELCTNQSLCSIIPHPILDSDYLYFYLDSQYRQLRAVSTGDGTRGGLNLKMIREYKIPLPPLEIQREIVRILDAYSEKVAELTDRLAVELDARKKQYEYYLDSLLTSDACLVYDMKDVATFSYGYTDTAKDVGTARFIRITDIDDSGNLRINNKKYVDLSTDNERYLVKDGDILMARTGATYGKTLYVSTDEPAIYASFLIKVNLDNTKVLNRYYWYFSKSSLYWRQAENLSSKGGQPQFNSNALARVRIPLPPLAEQERIVSILDRFDKLCSDISEGIPAEIEARRKQYEHYRDRLLTFKEIPA